MKTSICDDLFEHPIIKDLCEKHKCTPAQLVLSWSLHRKCSVIPRSGNSDRLKENFECQNVTLEQEEIDQISSLNENKRMCDDKIPWMCGVSLFA